MLSNIKAHYEKAETVFDERPLRERLFGIIIFTVVLLVIFDFVWLSEQNSEIKKQRSQSSSIQNEILEYENKINQVYLDSQHDPNQEYYEKLEGIDIELKALDDKIFQLNKVLIKPQDMTGMLNDLLEQQQNLNILSVRNLPMKSVNSQTGLENVKLYKHTVEIVLEGEYQHILQYIDDLQKTQWTIYWDDLTYKVKEYPLGRLTLHLYTLSLNKHWIGA